MKKFLVIILFNLLGGTILSLLPPSILAAPAIHFFPNPLVANDGRANYVFVRGCPENTSVTFAWTKNNTVTETATVKNGTAYISHSYSKGTYTMKATCNSTGESTTATFESKDAPSNGYYIPGAFRDSEEPYSCKSISFKDIKTLDRSSQTNPFFPDQASCQAGLNTLLSFQKGWYPTNKDTLGGDNPNGTECHAYKLMYPVSGIQSNEPPLFYSDKAQCDAALAATTNHSAVSSAPGILPYACVKDPNGIYKSETECKQSLVFYVAHPNGINGQTTCINIPKEKLASGETSYPTKEECETARVGAQTWKYTPPDQALNATAICSLSSTPGGYTSQLACENAFCEEVETRGLQINQLIFNSYCKDVGDEVEEEIAEEQQPTPIPRTRPPCTNGITYNFEDGDDTTTTDNTDIDFCTEYESAIGPISTDVDEFVQKMFAFLLSISGGLILILLMYSGYQIITSQGNPDKIKEARERITSTFIGLLFLVLSFIILEVIGVDLLHIPGLTP